ncbi:MAG: hypothetical protein ABR907_07625 [Terracidiphilus sp.]|jgi:hypothetical protein
MTSKTYPAFPHPEPKAIIIYCGDPRFLVATRSFIGEELGFTEGEYLPLSLPGGIASLSEPFALPKDFKVLKEGLQFYLEHMSSITEVILISHEDCRKYQALSEKLGSLKMMKGPMAERQYADLRKVGVVASKLVARNIAVRRYYARFANEEHTQVVFEAA